MTANCLFCYSLNIKQARPKSGYWKESFGKCSKKDHHIIKNIRGCSYFSQIGSHYQNYIDWVEKYAQHMIEVVKVMNEESPQWYPREEES